MSITGFNPDSGSDGDTDNIIMIKLHWSPSELTFDDAIQNAKKSTAQKVGFGVCRCACWSRFEFLPKSIIAEIILKEDKRVAHSGVFLTKLLDSEMSSF